tara:strand:- start:1543 stop:2103 length:561 start_codon:yes stop_codon:yes gene_type:complete
MLKINIIKGEKDPVVKKEIFFKEAKKALNGDVMILDHDLIDIVVSKSKSKISTFPKKSINEEAYHTQTKILESLATRGVLERSSIRFGSVHSSLEGFIIKSKLDGISSFQMALLEVFNFLQEEMPNIKSRENYKDKLQDFFLDPEEKDSTELGEVPHKEKKGSMDHQVRPYGYQYMYSILREMSEN